MLVVFATLGPLVATNVMWFRSLDRIGPARATLAANLQPFVAAAIAVVLLSEALGCSSWRAAADRRGDRGRAAARRSRPLPASDRQPGPRCGTIRQMDDELERGRAAMREAGLGRGPRVAGARRRCVAARRRRRRAARDGGLHARSRRRVDEAPRARAPCASRSGRNTSRGQLRIWVCMHHASRGELGPAGGWLARAERLLGDEDCAERGYLLIPAAFGAEAAGDFETAAATAASAAEIGQRFGDADLYALAAHMNGQFVIQAGAGRRGVPPARRGDGRGDLRLGLADRDRARLLRRDPRVRRGARRASRAASGRRCSPAGATSSPGSWRSPAAASCTGRRSCSCTATGRTPSRRRGGRPSGSCRGSTAPQQRRPSTGRARCSGSRGGSTRQRRPTARRAARVGAAARPGAPATRARAAGRGCCRHPPRSRRDDVWSRRAVLLPAQVEIALALASSRRRAAPPSS